MGEKELEREREGEGEGEGEEEGEERCISCGIQRIVICLFFCGKTHKGTCT